MKENNTTWRLLDTGLRNAAQNMALNKVLLQSHQQGTSPHTLRFLQFTPCALLGFHQSAGQELRVDYCRSHGIEIQRRITGGGAIYFDQTQLGWELYLDKKTLGTADMAQIAKRICEAAARAISTLGVDAKFRPRNDIEVDGRKVSGTGGAFDGDSILYQGTLLLDFDVERMLRVLRIPAEKLSDKAISSARERVVNIKELLGFVPELSLVKQRIAAEFSQEFGVTFAATQDLNDMEQDLYNRELPYIQSDDWIYQHDKPLTDAPLLESIIKSEGGLLRTSLLMDANRRRIKQVWITGDFFVTPKRLIADLEAALKDSLADELNLNIKSFFESYDAEMLMLKPVDFENSIRAAIQSGNAVEPAI